MTIPPAFRAKLSSKNQLVIPAAIRTALGLRSGDEIAFRLTDGLVTVEKAGREENPFHYFDEEWQSAADSKAYGDL